MLFNLTDMDFKNFKPDNAKAIAIILIVVAAIVFGIYYINKFLGGIGNIFSSITDKLGLTTDPEVKAQQDANKAAIDASVLTTSPWSPLYYQQAPNGAALYTQDTADGIAEQFWDTVSWFWGGDWTALMNVMKQIGTKSQLSFICDRFQQLHGKDLYSWLATQYPFAKDGSGNFVMSQVNNIANSLPAYN